MTTRAAIEAIAAQYPCWHLLQPSTQEILIQLDYWCRLASSSASATNAEIARQRRSQSNKVTHDPRSLSP